ncbi:MAG TPA: PLAT/LH2 domain-containing protein, partial [Pyrinomonadaceae bacterium]|nr:PLAT/LH2 domain-containing protein [Pyrinomonadaceae bacterium]
MAIALLACGARALAAPPENMGIWRAQIFLQTFNTSDAGTDDKVRVELRSNNGTWLDSPQDDWEVGSRTYELRLDNITRLSDLDYLRISKTGSNGWCIGRILLIVNGLALYDEQFPSGHWLDNSGGHTNVYFIDDYFMRLRAEWANYVAPTRPDVVPVGSLKARIQGLFGDFLTDDSNLGFGSSNPVSIGTLDANSWRVHVDVDDEKPWPVPDQDVEVDFDLTVGWAGNLVFVRPSFTVENLNVDYTWPGYGGSARTFMNNNFKPRFDAMMKGFGYTKGSGIQIAPNGDLHFLPIVFNPYPFPITPGVTTEQGRAMNTFAAPHKSGSPLALRVKTGGEFKAQAETAFTATLASGLEEDAEVEITFTLPAGVSLPNPVIEADDGEGVRILAPQFEAQNDGTTLVSLRERVAAGKAIAYVL